MLSSIFDLFRDFLILLVFSASSPFFKVLIIAEAFIFICSDIELEFGPEIRTMVWGEAYLFLVTPICS